MVRLLSCFVVALLAASLPAAEKPLDRARLTRIDDVVQQAIKANRAPGAVVLVLHRGEIVHRKAYGFRQLEPTREPMTVDTVFDLASLTKPLATATALMLLLEDGKLRLDDPVHKFLPTFARHGKDSISLEHLLLHTSGLPAGNAVSHYQNGKSKALDAICDLKPATKPGVRCVYSDLGFILLGAIVEQVSGKPLDTFCRDRIFQPLKMTTTGFRPGKELAARAAPTEKVRDQWLRGEVHDPRARALGGVAGHAGLFGTADDLATYATMLLANGGKILRPQTVRRFTLPTDVSTGKRTPGWDARTGFSSPRGRHLGGFGHTGFTGTSLWIDHASRTAIIILTNRVHPNGKGNVTALRSGVADVVADALGLGRD